MSTMSERAVLMRFSAGVPGEEREDHRVSNEIKRDKGLSADAGKWEKRLWPVNALASVKSKINEARKYHNSQTIPFDTGTGILPASRVIAYNAKMNEYTEQIKVLAESDFLSRGQEWIDWAKSAHNGTFEPDNYPGCKADGTFDLDEFKTVMRRKFYVRGNMMPVPHSSHYQSTVALVLGQDTDSIDQRVNEAAKEAQQNLLDRLIAPVQHMARKLSEDKPRIYETLIGNISEIAEIASDLNVTGNPEIDSFVAEVKTLAKFSTEELRTSSHTRKEAQAAAQATLARLSGYKL